MRKFILIFVVAMLVALRINAQIITPFNNGVGCKSVVAWSVGTPPTLAYLPLTTVEACTNVPVPFAPPCKIDVTPAELLLWSFSGVKIYQTGVGAVTATNPLLTNGYTYEATFTQGGTFRIDAYYSFLGTPPVVKSSLFFNVTDADGASQFNLNATVLCPQSNNSITLIRTQPSNTLFAYEVKLYEVAPVGGALTQVWTSGYTYGDFPTYTIGTAQYTGFTPGKNYRVSLLAVPEKTGSCRKNRSINAQDFNILNTAITPNFKIQSTDIDLITPRELYICDANPVFSLQNSTVSYAPVEYNLSLYNYNPDDGTRTLVYTAPTWTSTPATQLPNILVPGANYIVRWSVRSTCPPNTVVFKEGWVRINGLPTVGALNFKFERPNGAPIGPLYNRNQTTPTAANPINAPLTGGVTAKIRVMASSLVDIKPTIEVVNCNTGGQIPIVGGPLSTILCNPSFTQNVYTGTDLTNGLGLNNFYLDADGFNYSGTVLAQNYFTTLAAADFLGNTTILSDKCFKITLEGKSPYCANAVTVSQWSYFRFQRKSGNSLCPLCRTFDADADVLAQYLNIDANSLRLYPNPARNEINIGFVAQQEGKARIVLTDLTGRTVKDFYQTIVEGENIVTQSVEDLPNALYIYTVQAGSQNLSGKFIKQD